MGFNLQQQVEKHGLYENASEYVRALIRNDLKSRRDDWGWLKNELEPAMRADESAFIPVTAEAVIQRNTTR